MTTSLNSSIPARDTSTQLIHFLRKRFLVGQSGGLITTVSSNLGKLPANAAIVGGVSGIWVVTATEGTTSVVDVGFAVDSLSSSDVNAYASALAIGTTGGFFPFDEDETATAKPRANDTQVIVTFTGPATTGELDVILGYVPLNV